MRSYDLLIAALASSAVAMPYSGWQEWNTTSHSTTKTSTTSSLTTTSHSTTESVTSSSTSLTPLPTHNSTTPTTTPGHNATWPTHHHSRPTPSASTITSTFTTTDFITKTKFIPCSTPVATSHGTVYYSTYLTTEIFTTTSCYPVVTTIIPHPPAHTTPAAQPPVTTSGPGYVTPPANCPAAVTVTVTEYPHGGAGGYYQPGQCHTCQTLTYTDVHGHVVTIAVPKQPWGSETATQKTTSTTTKSSSSTTTKTTTSGKSHGTGSWTKSTKPTGTGNSGKPTKPTGTGNSTKPTTTSAPYGTGKYTPKPYPTGAW